jgi:hypothetical protein
MLARCGSLVAGAAHLPTGAGRRGANAATAALPRLRPRRDRESRSTHRFTSWGAMLEAVHILKAAAVQPLHAVGQLGAARSSCSSLFNPGKVMHALVATPHVRRWTRRDRRRVAGVARRPRAARPPVGRRRILVLGAYGFVATLQPDANFGRARAPIHRHRSLTASTGHSISAAWPLGRAVSIHNAVGVACALVGSTPGRSRVLRIADQYRSPAPCCFEIECLHGNVDGGCA